MPTSKRVYTPFIAILGMIIAMVGFAGPASAVTYTIQPTISVSTQTPAIGSSLRVCGKGFHARTRVTLTLDRRTGLGSVVATATGTFCKIVRLPDTVSGSHRIWANDGHGRVASALLRIIGPGISLSRYVVAVGSNVTVCGRLFHARTRVILSLDRRPRLGTIVTNSRGAFCKAVKLPPRVLGSHAIWANDSHGRVAKASIRIVRPGTRVAGVSLSAESASGAGTTTGGDGTTIDVAGVSAGDTTSSGGLAFTGATIIGAGALGGLLLLGGGLMLLSGRRRKTHS